jgi:hypothetical protein
MANLQPSGRGPRLASSPAGRSKRAGCFATGDEKVLEESNEKTAGLTGLTGRLSRLRETPSNARL